MTISSTPHRVEVEPGVTLFALDKYARSDEGATPRAILCLHGAGVDHRVFDCALEDYSVLDLLARKGYHAFGVDFRGFGQSAKPDDGKRVTAETCLADTLMVVDYIRARVGCKRVSLLGVSFGALVASMAAERAPAVVDRLVLTGFFYANLNPAALQMLTPETLQMMALAPNGYMPQSPAMLQASLPCADKSILDWNFAAFTEPIPNGPFLSASALPLVQDPAKITAPTLIVNGAHDVFANEPDSRAFVERISSPVKAYHLLPDCGHVPFFERDYREFQRLVGEYLQ